VSRPSLLRRLAHDVLYAHQYQVEESGAVVELCRHRITRRVTAKVSAPGGRPDFQRVGGAR
jgi:hypothetical protein